MPVSAFSFQLAKNPDAFFHLFLIHPASAEICFFRQFHEMDHFSRFQHRFKFLLHLLPIFSVRYMIRYLIACIIQHLLCFLYHLQNGASMIFL